VPFADYRFSERFGLDRDASEDWFDVVLPVDTELFVDPFLIWPEDKGEWADAHDRLIDFFNFAIELMQRSMKDGRFDRKSPHYQAAARMLLFPEPSEFCLGYGETPMGLGAGWGLRGTMLRAAETTINLGIEDVNHFEELTLFQDQIGPDRISDITCNVLKSHFIAYTKRVIEEHGLTDMTQNISIPHSDWSRDAAGWLNRTHRLIRNPFTGKAVLLVPERFLRKLPTVDPYEFWDWAFANESDQIKGQFNYDVGRGVKKSQEIARMASRNVELVRRYIAQLEKEPKPAYPLTDDPRGEVSWYDAAQQIGALYKGPKPPQDEDDFCNFIESLLDEFKHVIEDRGVWDLLWNGNVPRKERHVQLAFTAVMYGFCKTYNIDFSPESNAGSGPVDFKFSQGWTRRAAIEIKLANNSHFWNGLKRQIIQYLKAEGIKCGFFLSVQFSEEDMSRERVERVEEAAKDVSSKSGRSVKPKFVNAMKRPSASKL